MNSNISKYFYPKSICIAGASTKEKSIGYELLKTIINYDYKGKLYPVNPKAEEVLGLQCYRSVSAIEDEIDLAVIVVPKQFVEQTIDELLLKEVKAIVLITAGFKEIGKEGVELEEKILAKIRSGEARMTGPNCMGVINTLDKIRLNATFVAEKPEKGSMAFLSQSGALGAAVLNSLRDTDIKFAHFVSVGNKTDLNENDFLNYWETDDNIKLTTCYLESFENGFEFIKPFMLGEIKKPVIVLKSGRTAAGMKAASSHTGALSGEDRIVSALLDQFGVVRADNLNDMFNMAKGFENFPSPAGNRVAVVTNAGGPAILAVDALESYGLTLAVLSDSTKEKLKEVVHPEGSVNNPVDLLPGGDDLVYKKVIEILLEDDNVDSVVSIFVEPVMVEPLGVVEAVNSIESNKPVLQVIMPLPEFWDKYRNNSSNKKPLFRNPEDPAVIISNMLIRNSAYIRIQSDSDMYRSLLKIQPRRIEAKDGFISQERIESLLAEYEVPSCKSIIYPADKIKYAEGFDYPVVLKAIGENIVHKSDLGAVSLNISNRDELIRASNDLKKNTESNGISIEQFQVQEYVEAKHELLIGGFRDASFGPVIMFGSGGKYVEIMKDIVIKSAYSSEFDLKDMIEKTNIGKILKGVRGEKGVDLPGLVGILLRCCKLLIENNNITEFDINPLMVTESGELKAVDVRVKIENSFGGG